MTGLVSKEKVEIVSLDSIFWICFLLPCFSLVFVSFTLLPSTLLSDDLVKTKFALIARVSRAFPM